MRVKNLEFCARYPLRCHLTSSFSSLLTSLRYLHIRKIFSHQSYQLSSCSHVQTKGRCEFWRADLLQCRKPAENFATLQRTVSRMLKALKKKVSCISNDAEPPNVPCGIRTTEMTGQIVSIICTLAGEPAGLWADCKTDGRGFINRAWSHFSVIFLHSVQYVQGLLLKGNLLSRKKVSQIPESR